METLAGVTFMMGVVAYSVAGTLFFVNLARREGAPSAVRWANRVLVLAAVLHASHIVLASFITQICPVASTPFGLSLAALVTCVAFLFVRRRPGLGAMGVVVAPLALMFLIGAQFVEQGPAQSEFSPTLLALHAATNLLGLGLFLLAAAASGFYLLQERRLKTKRRALHAGKLPALDLLDSTEHRLLLAGFPLLTIGVVTGAIFLGSLHSQSVNVLARAALAYVSWGLVASMLLLRSVAGWRGRRTAYGTLAAAACVLLVLFVYVLRAGGSTGL